MAPGLVIRYSPWIEPVMRAGMEPLGGGASAQADLRDEWCGRIAGWGDAVLPLRNGWLRDSPSRRAVALACFPLWVPESQLHTRQESNAPGWRHAIISIQDIQGDGAPWYLLRLRSGDAADAGLDFIVQPSEHRWQTALRKRLDLLYDRADQHAAIGSDPAFAQVPLEIRAGRTVPLAVIGGMLSVARLRSVADPHGRADRGDRPPAAKPFGASPIPPARSAADVALSSGAPRHRVASLPSGGGGHADRIALQVDGGEPAMIGGEASSIMRLLSMAMAIAGSLGGVARTDHHEAVAIEAPTSTAWSDMVAAFDGLRRQRCRSGLSSSALTRMAAPARMPPRSRARPKAPVRTPPIEVPLLEPAPRSGVGSGACRGGAAPRRPRTVGPHFPSRSIQRSSLRSRRYNLPSA